MWLVVLPNVNMPCALHTNRMVQHMQQKHVRCNISGSLATLGCPACYTSIKTLKALQPAACATSQMLLTSGKLTQLVCILYNHA